MVLLFTYLVFIAATLLNYLFQYKEKEQLAKAFGRLASDIVYRGFIYLLYTLLVQIAMPIPFAVALLFINLLTFIFILVGHLKPDKWKIRLGGLLVQLLLDVILMITAFSGSWCAMDLYRFVTEA